MCVITMLTYAPRWNMKSALGVTEIYIFINITSWWYNKHWLNMQVTSNFPSMRWTITRYEPKRSAWGRNKTYSMLPSYLVWTDGAHQRLHLSLHQHIKPHLPELQVDSQIPVSSAGEENNSLEFFVVHEVVKWPNAAFFPKGVRDQVWVITVQKQQLILSRHESAAKLIFRNNNILIQVHCMSNCISLEDKTSTL